MVMVEGIRRSEETTKRGHIQINFWEVVNVGWSHAYHCNIVCGTHGFKSDRRLDNPIFEIWM
jgi:hypothetical protein